jgi:hypothetical protein
MSKGPRWSAPYFWAAFFLQGGRIGRQRKKRKMNALPQFLGE